MLFRSKTPDKPILDPGFSRFLTTAFKDFILNLEHTFEKDFAPYQPDLSLLDLVSPAGRQQFNQSLETAFQRYLNDQLLRWSRTLEPTLRSAFQTLSQRAAHYGTSYNQITQQILTKIGRASCRERV